MESQHHTEREAFCGSRKLYFTSYLALCTILKIATLWKHLNARINWSWKKNLPNKVRFCKFPESSSLSQITVTSLENTYVSWNINAKHLLSNGKRKIARISPLIKWKVLSASSFSPSFKASGENSAFPLILLAEEHALLTIIIYQVLSLWGLLLCFVCGSFKQTNYQRWS